MNATMHTTHVRMSQHTSKGQRGRDSNTEYKAFENINETIVTNICILVSEWNNRNNIKENNSMIRDYHY